MKNDFGAFNAVDGDGPRGDGGAVRCALLGAAVMRAIGMIVTSGNAGAVGAVGAVVMRHAVASRLGCGRLRQAAGVIGGDLPEGVCRLPCPGKGKQQDQDGKAASHEQQILLATKTLHLAVLFPSMLLTAPLLAFRAMG